MSSPSATDLPQSADVVVVGAGPGGSATAAHLAKAGLDVVLLERATFPREKVCGDALGPRAVRELVSLGVPTPESEGWMRTKGVRLVGAGVRMQLDWPESATFPPYGLIRSRTSLDEILALHAVKNGAHLVQGCEVTGPVTDGRGRVVGVTAVRVDADGRAGGPVREVRAPLVVAADGGSSPLSRAAGRQKRADRPVGVAVRTYFTSPRTHDEYLESWLEVRLPHPVSGREVVLPGHGWVFGLGDGTSNVGLGLHAPGRSPGDVDHADVLRRWVRTMPPEWTFTDETMTQPIRGAALPMGFARQPHYADGLLLVGDAGGMVNPFTGEGVAYALESGRIAADVVAHAYARDDLGRERVLASYNTRLKQDLGGYFTLGRHFAALTGNPEVVRLATKYGLPRTTLMKFLLKATANLAEPGGRGVADRVINTLSRIAPDA